MTSVIGHLSGLIDMSTLFKLGLLGAGVWAFKQGHFDRLGYQIQSLAFASPETALGGVAGGLTGGFDALADLFGLGDDMDVVEPVTPTIVAPVSPEFVIAQASNGLTKEEQYLQTHWGEVHPWARANKTWVAAMMWQESRGNPQATSHADARGLMQVIDGTMQWMYDLGYRKYPVNSQSLYNPAISIYFGTAFLEYLHSIGKGRGRDWITRAYNAGPGGQRGNGTWPAETVNYLKVIKARNKLLESN
jgi:hypothetical protein